jgi:phosphotriesterase-related protein
LFPNEEKSLKATAMASRETGVSISIHPGRHVDAPFQILDILERAGADIGRVVMGHMERTGLDSERLIKLARTGCYLEYDWFGEVRPTYPYGRVDVPSDGERIKTLAYLIDEGFGDRLLVSHDVCFKTRLSSYGGPGYAHILKYVKPWMKALGVKDEAVDRILIDNPRRILPLV